MNSEDDMEFNGETEVSDSSPGKLRSRSFTDKSQLASSLHSEYSEGTVQDVPPNEKVVGIDHILEKILLSLETSDLLSYRLVSQRWKLFTSVELQNRTALMFYNHILGPTPTTTTTKHIRLNERENEAPFLPNLTVLLQNSQDFPCNKFNFISYGKNKNQGRDVMRNLRDEILQDFLNTQGDCIAELSLRFKDDPKYLLSENDLMELIKTLLIHQAPNLRFLSLRLPSKIEWEINKNNDNSPREERSPLRTSDPEYTAIISEVNKIPITNKNTKLRVLKLQSGFVPSAKILELIIQLAPNLDKIIVDPSNYSYFLKPFNRLHLLKNVWFNPKNGGLDKSEYENIAFPGTETGTGAESENLQLRHITLNLEQFRDWSPTYERRVVRVINRLFHSSWNSLETVSWNGVIFLLGMELPVVMPSVWKLSLSNVYNHPGQELFPSGFNLADRFPKLRSVTLFYLGEDSDNFLNCLCFEPVKSVRIVQVSWEPVPAEHLAQIYKLFPCAESVSVYETT